MKRFVQNYRREKKIDFILASIERFGKCLDFRNNQTKLRKCYKHLTLCVHSTTHWPKADKLTANCETIFQKM
jgi:hypothetical protein